MPGTRAPVRDRILRSIVIDENGCWLWQMYKNEHGYGLFKVVIGLVAHTKAHRASYAIFKGEIPEGKQLDHTCHNEALATGLCAGGRTCAHRSCVNPDHLEPVTCRTNLLRGETISAANAAKTHCPQGHPYDLLNTLHTVAGRRKCRICHRAMTQRWREKTRTSAA